MSSRTHVRRFNRKHAQQYVMSYHVGVHARTHDARTHTRTCGHAGLAYEFRASNVNRHAAKMGDMMSPLEIDLIWDVFDVTGNGKLGQDDMDIIFMVRFRLKLRTKHACKI